MSRFEEETRVIPPAAWITAVVLYAGFVALILLVLIPQDPKLSVWPEVGRGLFAAVIPLFLLVLVLLIGYVNGDARRRGMRAGLWTLLAIFIPNALGIILYFILRDPPLSPCSKCGAIARRGFGYCPSCGTPLGRVCPACKFVVEPGWAHCPNCGAGLRAA